MELSIKDRLYIPALLPKEGSFHQFNTKKSILHKIEISQEERQEVGLKENQDTKRIEWDIEKEMPLVLEFSSDEMTYLKQSFEKISDEQLPDDMWSVVEKIYNAIQEIPAE
ncbi:RNA-binding protein [Bacteroides fragilis]|uniref:RNA-binding protein n=1 Tax=Bacteroides fragilis TaxID=817 RepID=A0A396C9M5_BACFG|nr:RNA-binding protein [Bacteroides fragilis]RHH14336.1 RNA-binding protein [Bacteroides fragilis]